jgi:protein CpxP
MKTLKSLMLLTIMVLVTTVAFAQQQRQVQRVMGPDMEIPADFLASLNLTDAQKAKFFDLRIAHAKEAQVMRETAQSGDVSPNQLTELRNAMRAKHDTELKGILNPEQYEKMVAFRTDRQEYNRELRQKRQDYRGPGNGMRPGSGQRPRGNRVN